MAYTPAISKTIQSSLLSEHTQAGPASPSRTEGRPMVRSLCTPQRAVTKRTLYLRGGASVWGAGTYLAAKARTTGLLE